MTSALFLSFFDLETAIEKRQEQTFLKITYKVFGLKCSLYLEGSRLLYEGKISVQKNFKPGTYLIVDMKDLVLFRH